MRHPVNRQTSVLDVGVVLVYFSSLCLVSVLFFLNCYEFRVGYVIQYV